MNERITEFFRKILIIKTIFYVNLKQYIKKRVVVYNIQEKVYGTQKRVPE